MPHSNEDHVLFPGRPAPATPGDLHYTHVARFENHGSVPVLLWVEPWADEYFALPGEGFDLIAGECSQGFHLHLVYLDQACRCIPRGRSAGSVSARRGRRWSSATVPTRPRRCSRLDRKGSDPADAKATLLHSRPDRRTGKRPRDVQTELRLLKAVPRLRKSRERAVDMLIRATRHRNARVRWRSAYLLGKTGQKRALPELLALAENDPEQEVRHEALLAIGYLRCPAAAPHLARVIETVPEGDPRRSWGCIALSYTGIAALPELLRLLASDCWEIRYGAAGALPGWEFRHCAHGVEALRRLLDDSDERVRMAAAECLESVEQMSAEG